MKKNRKNTTQKTLPEYNCINGRRGKYYRRYQKGTNVVILDPDIAKVFPDSQTVNEALRALTRLDIKKPVGKSA